MTSFDFDVIGDSPKQQSKPAEQKPVAEQKPGEKTADLPETREKAA